MKTIEKGQPQMTELENNYKTELQWHSLEKALDIITIHLPEKIVSEAIKCLRK
jgi:hypothetical protein